MNGFWSELKQRRVVRVTIAYAVVAYAIVQGATTFFPALRFPDWTVTLVAVLAILGLPIAIVLSWIFQITPEGITRTPRAGERRPVTAGAIAVVGAVLVLFIAVAAFLLLPSADSSAARLDPNRILVVPFDDNTGDPALTAVGRMSADWLTQGLIQASLGEVVDRAALEDASTAPRTPVAQARAAGAGTVVSGAYYKQADTIYIRAQIIDANSGDILSSLDPSSAPVSRPVRAVEQLRARVLTALASKAGEDLLEAALVNRPPNYEAYQSYVKGLSGPQSTRGQHLARAVALDTSFDQARIQQLWNFAMMRETARADSVIAVLDARVERLTPLERAMFERQRGFAHWDMEQTYIAAKQLAKLAPGVHSAALEAMRMNHAREAIEEAERVHPALRSKQFNRYYAMIAASHHMLGDYRREQKVLKEARPLFPDTPAIIMADARNLAALNQPGQALARIEQLMRAGTPLSQDELMWHPALELAAHGHKSAADSVFSIAIRTVEAQPPVSRALPRAQRDYIMLHIYAKRYERARILLDSTARLDGAADRTPWMVGAKGYLAAVSGRRSEAGTILARLQQPPLSTPDDPFERHGPSIWAAAIAAQLANKEEALRLLRGHSQFALVQSNRNLPLHTDSRFDALRGWPPFEDYVRPTK